MLDDRNLIDALEQLPEGSTADEPYLVGLNLYECVQDLIKHPELIGRVRKVICDEWPESARMTPRRREVIEELRPRLYFPKREGRAHQMPAGNPAWRIQRMPSQWWIANLDYRKVLIRKLRALCEELRGRR